MMRRRARPPMRPWHPCRHPCRIVAVGIGPTASTTSGCNSPWSGKTARGPLLVGNLFQVLQIHAMHVASIVMKGIPLCSLFLACSVSVAQTNAVTLSQSPDGVFQLRRMQSDPGERGEAQKILEITDREGKSLFSWISPLGSSLGLWSSDSRFLAINDSPGRGGDQLWVFCLDPVAKRVLLIREPEGKKLRAEVESHHGNFLSLMEGVTLRALEWRENRLWCSVHGTFSPKRNRRVHVPFHYLWVLGMGGDSTSIVEEWTRTDPKERPLLDQVQ